MMQNIVDAGIGRLLVQFDGVMICNHAASHVLLEHFESPYEWEEEEIDGLGLLSDFALMSDYVEDVQHLRRLIRNIEEKGRAVFAFGKDGGVVIHHGLPIPSTIILNICQAAGNLSSPLRSERM